MSGDTASKENPSQKSEKTEGLGCFFRMLWMGAGNIGLLFSFFAIARDPNIKLNFSWVDPLFWAIVIIMIIARYVDINKLGGRTTSNQPATMKHWRRYVILLIVIGFLGWAGAHLVSYYAII